MARQTYTRKDGVDSENISIQQGTEQLKDGKLSAGGIEIEKEQVHNKNSLDLEAFMAQELDIYLNEPNSDNEPLFCEVNVNGDYRLLVRGEQYKLPRRHIAVLARAKQSRVRQKKVTNPDGSIGFREENVLSLSYPFSITHDPAGKKGVEWVKKLLGNPSA